MKDITASTIIAFLIVHIDGLTRESNGPISNHPCRISGFFRTVGDKKVSVFLGIPYAKPPLGELRFKPPKPMKMCDNNRTVHVYEKMPNKCYQMIDQVEESQSKNIRVKMSEDCLYLNIFTPEFLPGLSNLPTVVWMSGESFYNGSISSDQDNPLKLVAEYNIVVVQIQYRLGSFGFLNLGDGDIKGNMGLLDQVMAMEWVNKSIQYFLGDPNDITLMGQGAGAVSVGYHMMSNLSRHFFHKAVMQSGSPFNHKAFMSPKESVRTSMMILGITSCGKMKGKQLKNCLITLSSQSLVEADGKLPMLTPTVDGHFMEKSPLQVVMDKDYSKIPVLAGINQNEAMPGIKRFLRAAKDLKFEDFSQKNFDWLLQTMQKFTEMNTKEMDILGNFYKSEYGKDSKINFREAAFQFFGDVFLSCPMMQFMSDLSTYGAEVYFYNFNYRSALDTHPEYTEVLQGSEIQYQFGRPMRVQENYNDDDRKLSKLMMILWKTFILTGKPEDSWETFAVNYTKVIKYGSEPFMLKKKEMFCDKWKLYLKFPIILDDE